MSNAPSVSDPHGYSAGYGYGNTDTHAYTLAHANSNGDIDTGRAWLVRSSGPS